MKEFDLKLAKAGKTVCTRDGKKARIICFDKKDKVYPIIALIGDDEQCYTYTNKGSYNLSCTNSKDLMMAGTHHEGWINIYKYANYIPTDKIYETKEDALADIIDKDYFIDSVKVEWED